MRPKKVKIAYYLTPLVEGITRVIERTSRTEASAAEQHRELANYFAHQALMLETMKDPLR